MKNFCVCLQNIGQGPLSTHFNVIIKRALGMQEFSRYHKKNQAESTITRLQMKIFLNYLILVETLAFL